MNAGEQDNGQSTGQIGPILERKRREKGLSLKDVEQATKIRTRYLEGLEREDPTVLPDPVYARGFLKTYANFLGLDGDRLSRELRDRRAPRRERQLSREAPDASEFEQPLLVPGGVVDAERRRVSGGTILSVALALFVLVGVIGALYYVGSRSADSGANEAPEEPVAEQSDSQSDSNSSPAPSRNEEVGTESTTGTASDDAREATPQTVPVTVRVLDAPAGLTVTADGVAVLDTFAQPGFSQTFDVQRVLTVSTGNAGSVEVEVGGQNLGRLGRAGQGATRDFPVQPPG